MKFVRILCFSLLHVYKYKIHENQATVNSDKRDLFYANGYYYSRYVKLIS